MEADSPCELAGSLNNNRLRQRRRVYLEPIPQTTLCKKDASQNFVDLLLLKNFFSDNETVFPKTKQIKFQLRKSYTWRVIESRSN